MPDLNPSSMNGFVPDAAFVDGLLRRLFPIARSLTGPGNDATLAILREIIPLTVREVRSGSKVFDWTIPPEWRIRDAYVKNAAGKKIIDWNASNLHVLNYSEPVSRQDVSETELRAHLYTLPDKPDWIPYRTSYYARNWGFCAAHRLLESSDFKGPFEVKIDSELDEGGRLVFAEAVHKGISDQEILISSYFCHPSLANDNLSGFVTAVLFFNEIRKHKTHYTYRLVLCPETIGAIAFLHSLTAPEKLAGGCVLSTTAGPGPLGIKKSFLGDHAVDSLAVLAVSAADKDWKEYPFIPDGSDERQYSSPGFRIPTVTICKSKYYEYEEYHTSADNLDFIKPEYLLETLRCYLQWFRNLEANRVYRRTMMFGEYQLGKRGLFPNVGGSINQIAHAENKSGFDARQYSLQINISGRHLDAYNWIMHLADGARSVLDMSRRSGTDFQIMSEACSLFESKGLLEVIG